MGFSHGKTLDRRLALYAYLGPMVEGARVLELGGDAGAGAEKLVGLGAASVVSAGADTVALSSPPRITRVRGFSESELKKHGPFDLVVIPRAESLFTAGGVGGLSWPVVRNLVAPEGHLVCQVKSADANHGVGRVDRERSGGEPGPAIGYYELVDRLTPLFPVVRTFGQTAFVALGIAEFDVQVSDLHVASDLIDPDNEEPSHYIAIAGRTEGPRLGYALVQLPIDSASLLTGPSDEAPLGRPAHMATAASDQSLAARLPDDFRQALAEKERQLAELAHKVIDAEGRADGVARVSRAQTEEIEELRGRLRRAADMRAELDDEIGRLRRALAEADESVMSLTRKTADEMTALAAQLTAGLRPAAFDRRPAPAETAALTEQIKQRDAVLAQRESAIFERDERIAALEIEKQDLTWQRDAVLSEADRLPGRAEKVRRLGPSPSSGAEGTGRPALDPGREQELLQTLAARDRALNEFRNAAAMHLQESEKLRSAVVEQAAHVEELQEALAAVETRAQAAEQEVVRLREALARAEEADRVRRSRLAEVQGTMLRLKHQQNAPVGGTQADEGLRAELETARRQITALQAAGADNQRVRDELARARDEIAALNARLATAEDSLHKAQDELASRQAPAGAGGDGPAQIQEGPPVTLEGLDPRVLDELIRKVTTEDIQRLREALDRSDENLREARGQLVPLHGRIAELEREKDKRAEAERNFFSNLVSEVAALEGGIQKELSLIDQLMRQVKQTGGPENEGSAPTSTALGEQGDRG